MAEPTVLEMIARKEQELRARLLAARARADVLVAEASKQAGEVRTGAEAEARAQTRVWVEQEMARARREAEQVVDQATADARDRMGSPQGLEAAVQLILDAVLARYSSQGTPISVRPRGAGTEVPPQRGLE
jgi:vacuolar-type H+-ATPase subunit H